MVSSIERRAKYLLLECELGSAILHLGMSGNLRVVNANEPLKKHDHVEFILANNKALRLIKRALPWWGLKLPALLM